MKQKNKPLAETNPYLKNPKKRAELIRMSVLTSSAVEGIYVNIKPLSLNQLSIPTKKQKKSIG